MYSLWNKLMHFAICIWPHDIFSSYSRNSHSSVINLMRIWLFPYLNVKCRFIFVEYGYETKASCCSDLTWNVQIWINSNFKKVKHCGVFTALNGIRKGNGVSHVCLFSRGVLMRPLSGSVKTCSLGNILPFSWPQPPRHVHTCSLGHHHAGQVGMWTVDMWVKCTLVLSIAVYVVFWYFCRWSFS